MARYRRRYRRRNNRKRVTGKKLSTMRVLTNKSATSQAKQIVALRNSVNRVRKMLPPVNKMTIAATATTWNTSSVSTLLTDVGFVTPMVMPQLYDGQDGDPVEGSNEDYRLGNWIKVHAAYWSLQLSYSFVFAATQTPTPYYDGRYSGVQARFVLLASKRTHSAQPTISDIFQIAGSTGTSYDLNATNPLKEGLGNRWTILSQRKVTLSTNNRLVSMRLKVPLSKIRNYISWDVQNPSDRPKHLIYLACITSGLKYQGFVTEAANALRIVYQPWLVFSNP